MVGQRIVHDRVLSDPFSWRLGRPVAGCVAGSKVADADATVRVDAEDFVEGKHGSGRSRDDRAANDAHFALVNIAAPNREPAVDDSRDAEDETEHHDYRQAV